MAPRPPLGAAGQGAAPRAGAAPDRAAASRRGVRTPLRAGRARRRSAVGVDEFLRAYLQPRGRAAFYAALRHIYLDEPKGEEGSWTRLRALERDSLFVWGRGDRLVPIAFARHVREVLPAAQHLELECGHVPQLEAPKETHAAIRRFLGAAGAARAA